LYNAYTYVLFKKKSFELKRQKNWLIKSL